MLHLPSLLARVQTSRWLARHDLPKKSAPEDSPVQNPFGPPDYGGHESLSLDLAPYRLNGHESLIGVRLVHQWLAAPMLTTRLLLYRIEGNRLREVFDDTIVDHDYPAKWRIDSGTIGKTTSVVSMRPTTGAFYDLVIRKTSFRCKSNEDGDCQSDQPPANGSRTVTEVWRFNGERFARR